MKIQILRLTFLWLCLLLQAPLSFAQFAVEDGPFIFRDLNGDQYPDRIEYRALIGQRNVPIFDLCKKNPYNQYAFPKLEQAIKTKSPLKHCFGNVYDLDRISRADKAKVLNTIFQLSAEEAAQANDNLLTTVEVKPNSSNTTLMVVYNAILADERQRSQIYLIDTLGQIQQQFLLENKPFYTHFMLSGDAQLIAAKSPSQSRIYRVADTQLVVTDSLLVTKSQQINEHLLLVEYKPVEEVIKKKVAQRKPRDTALNRHKTSLKKPEVDKNASRLLKVYDLKKNKVYARHFTLAELAELDYATEKALYFKNGEVLKYKKFK